jgi:hypothetical protein
MNREIIPSPPTLRGVRSSDLHNQIPLASSNDKEIDLSDRPVVHVNGRKGHVEVDKAPTLSKLVVRLWEDKNDHSTGS